MGDSTATKGPVHRVTITHAFLLQKTMVTQAEWHAVMGTDPSVHRNCPACPVDSVSYDDAQNFIAKLNALSPGKFYRLPTEAEWEYAARAGAPSDRAPPGVAALGGWTKENSGDSTHPVAQFPPNAWGLYDILGNLAQWVADWYGLYGPGPVTDPAGPPSGHVRVTRGGSMLVPAARQDVATRGGDPPTYRDMDVGFRLARGL